VARGSSLSDGTPRHGSIGGQFPVAGMARRRASPPLVTGGALGHGGEPRPPLPAVALQARHLGSGMRGVGEDDVPVGFRPSAPEWIGEAVPPRVRGIGGLAVTSGAIPGRCRPGFGGVLAVAGNACAFRDGHMAVVTERHITRSARHHQHERKQNDGKYTVADSRHPSDGTGEPPEGQARGWRYPLPLAHGRRSAPGSSSASGTAPKQKHDEDRGEQDQREPVTQCRHSSQRETHLPSSGRTLLPAVGDTPSLYPGFTPSMSPLTRNVPPWQECPPDRPATAGPWITLIRTASGAGHRRRKGCLRARSPSR